MKKIHFLLYFPVFFLCSALLSYYLLILNQTQAYTVLSHSFQLKTGIFIILLTLFCFLLLALWLFYSKTISRLYSIEYFSVLSQDFLTFLPIIFLSLLPLAASHYLSSNDLLSRFKLFGLAILLVFLYLKFVLTYHLGKENSYSVKRLINRFSSLSLRKKMLLLFLTALILHNTGSALKTSKGMTFSGDEPHFLIISHSLLQDGDIDLANNYANRDYAKFMLPQVKISPHLAPRTEGRYSFHSPGISLLLLPFYWLASFFKGNLFVFIIRFGMSIFGSLFGIQVFLYARQEWKRENLALGLWFLISFTSPVFFYSIHVYPEIIVALFSLTIFRLLRFSPMASKFSLIFCGLLISTFVYFHALKYVFITIPLFIYILWVLIKKLKKGWNTLYFLACPLIVTVFYFLLQYKIYGSFSLSSVSWRGWMTAPESISYMKAIITEIPFRVRWETLAGFFFDQRDGLLLYSPIYFFVFLGIIELARKKRSQLIVLLLLTAPYVLNSAFLTQRTGYAPQARPLVAVSWGLIILLGYFLAGNAKKIFSYLFGLAAFFSFLFVFLLLKNPSALYQLTTRGETERAGRLFWTLSNLHFYLPELLPSYLNMENMSRIPNYVWFGLVGLFVALYLIIKKHSFPFKFSIHAVISLLGLIIFFLWIVLYPRPVLLYPRNTSFPTGEKITFYSLGRVARMVEPGKFDLPQDNRPYIFHFSSWRKINKFQIDFGSLEGEYYVQVKYFDQELFKGNTSRELRTVTLSEAPPYRLKNTHLYRISIYLENRSEVRTSAFPYHFSIIPLS